MNYGPPERAPLRLKRCFGDAFSAWSEHLPVLFAGSLLAALFSLLSGALLLSSLYAGLSMMVLRAQQGKKPRLRDVFGQAPRFIRFFAIAVYMMLFFILGAVIILAPVFFSSAYFADVFDMFRHQIARETPWIIAIDAGDIARFIKNQKIIVIAPLLVLVLLFLPGIVFVVKCFYMFLLAADRGMRLDEARVESRKAVERYGFWKHLCLIAAAWGILIVANHAAGYLPGGLIVHAAFFALFTPLALGLFASAYEQTLCEETRQRERFRAHVAEMRDELQTAHDMQMGLLPQAGPNVPGYALHGTCIPANSVGGDYYAYRWLDKARTKLAVVVADVSGKAMEAAVVALRFNEMLRYECHNRTNPAAILEALNTSLEGQIDMASFITCCIAVLDVPTGQVCIANAGHCPPYRTDQEVRLVDVTGYPLGLPAIVRPKDPYATTIIALEPGDRLIMFSDGVVEAQNNREQFFDDIRFVNLLKSTPSATPPDQLVSRVVDDVKAFIGPAPRTDDITLVVLQRNLAPA